MAICHLLIWRIFMYRPAHLDGYLRLLATHLEGLVELGENIMELAGGHLEIGEFRLRRCGGWEELGAILERRREKEAMFAMQLGEAREWADRLGQFEPFFERRIDEFLVATLPIEEFVRTQANQLEPNEQIGAGQEERRCEIHPLAGDLNGHIDVAAMIEAVMELLARLDEEYDLTGELMDRRPAACGDAFALPAHDDDEDEAENMIIPLFGAI
jgi:hypothetical protein